MPLSEITKMKMPYRSKINVYVKRRSALKDKYGVKSKFYLKHSKSINKKLSGWRRAIKRIENWNEKLNDIDDAIIEYVGTSAKNSGMSLSGARWRAKHFMCRYAKDKGIPAIFIRAYIGLHGANAVGEIRMRLIRRCHANRELRNDWKNFKSRINS